MIIFYYINRGFIKWPTESCSEQTAYLSPGEVAVVEREGSEAAERPAERRDFRGDTQTVVAET